jgi:parallel beta-helix repeat protein
VNKGGVAMKKGKLTGKIFGKALVLVLIAVVVGGLPTTNNELAVNAAGGHLTYTVYATREGSVGGTTANGHVIVSHDHFVALPSTKVLCSNGGHEYEVKVTYNGKSVIAPVWDVGPWNTRDNYWDPPSQREMWQDLSQGKPEAQAAYQDGYNSGFDETNYLVKVSTGSDEFSVGDRVQPTVNGLKVRSTAGGVEIGSVLTSDKGTVIGGPQNAILNGLYYRWWNIMWDKGLSGWSAQKRYVSNPAGIDLADGTFWDDLGMTGNDWVTVEFLWTTAEDTTPPAVDAFTVTPGSVTSGNTFTISYTVSDTGGSGLGWIQLWRKYETASWEQVDSTTLSGVGDGSYSGSFSDTPLTVGTYWYGIHVGDDAGNWVTETDSGFSPIQVEVIAEDTMPPTVNAFSVIPSSVTTGNAFTISYTVSDTGGSGLGWIQLWRKYETASWEQVDSTTLSGVGNGPYFGSFSDTPLAVGIYWYGIHVGDDAGNWVTEGGSGFSPIEVEVIQAEENSPPNTPSNPWPANHATGVSVNADLSWTGGDPDAGDTVTYDVYFGTGSIPPLASNDQLGITYDAGTLAYNTKYYWKVIATDSHGASSTGPLWDFTTQSEPSLGTWYVDDDLVDYPAADFTRVQEAVDAASSGDTIIVYPGTYTENVDVNKDHLTIQSENGAETTIVQAANSDDHVFEVTADYVNISGFTIEGVAGQSLGPPFPAGIRLNGNHCVVSDNKISNRYHGIEINYSSNNSIVNNIASGNVNGIALHRSSDNTLTDNTTHNNSCGIVLNGYPSGSHNNVLTNNVVSDNHEGIQLYCSSNNTLSNNTILDNHWNFALDGVELPHFIQDIDTSNTINDKPIRYLIDKEGLTIDSNWDVGYLALINCRGIDVEDLHLANNGEGILLAYTTNSKIENVNLSNNRHSFHLVSSFDNKLISNIVSTYGLGIYCRNSSNNTIYLNNFVGLGERHGEPITHSEDSINTWHSPEEITYTYNGNTYTSYLGNYWSDYTGGDADEDGIGDTPYPIDSDADNYPLVEPFENYEIGTAEVTIAVKSSGSFLHAYDIESWFVPPDQIITAKIADSASLPLEVKVSRDSEPVAGARLFIQEDSFPLGITDENGMSTTRYPITHPPKAEEFEAHVSAEVGSSIHSSELLMLYGSRLIGNMSVVVTEHEARWYPAYLLLHYYIQPGVPSPKWLLNIKMFDLLAKIAADLNDYTPQAGDTLHFEAYEYTAPGVEIAYAVHMTLERGGVQIYERTQWTDRYELVEPIVLVKLARHSLTSSLASPANIWVTDPNGNHAGIDPQTGELVFEFAMAITAPGEEHQQIVIPDPLDGEYELNIIGTQNGSYSLTCCSIDESGHVSSTYNATDIPTTSGAVHQYTIDWDALSQGEKGVTVQIDSDGDGEFEDTFTSDGELTHDEFMHETIPQLLKQDAISNLEVIQPTKKTARRLIDDSIQCINKSLSNRLWADDSHLRSAAMAGAFVFDMEEVAVLKLKTAERIEPTIEDGIEAVIDKLTKADKLLCIIAINDAKSVEVKDPWKKKIVDREIARAEEQLDKACGYLEKDMPAWAITYFKLSWVYAQGAIKVAQADLPSRW